MLKNALWLFIAAFVILMIFLPSYSKLQDLRQRNADYAVQVRDLKQENTRLVEEKRRLEDDPVYLEKVAREKMGLAREGEVVYKMIPEDMIQDPQALKDRQKKFPVPAQR